MYFNAFALRCARVEHASQVQTTQIRPPAYRQMIVAMIAGNTHIHIVFRAALKRPFTARSEGLDQINRVLSVGLRHQSCRHICLSILSKYYMWWPKNAELRH